MDAVALGTRLASTRHASGVTQGQLGAAVGLDRSAISRLEKGERKLNVSELVSIAEALDVPLAHLIESPIPAVISRRRDAENTHGHTVQLDDVLAGFTSDLRFLLEMDLINRVTRRQGLRTPRSHAEAEQIAQNLREELHLGAGPVTDLGRTAEELGMVTLVTGLGEEAPDGACVEVSDEPRSLGAAVLNADKGSGRRRMTLVHELGHWIFGDAYDVSASAESEKLIQSFAIHFLAPRHGVMAIWNKKTDWSKRDRALAVSAHFRLSWTAALGQLSNLNLIDHNEYSALSRTRPRRGDFLRLGLDLHDDLPDGYVSPGFRSSVLRGYTAGRLTESRTLELMRGKLEAHDLPELEDTARDELRAAFAGHG